MNEYAEMMRLVRWVARLSPDPVDRMFAEGMIVGYKLAQLELKEQMEGVTMEAKR